MLKRDEALVQLSKKGLEQVAASTGEGLVVPT